MEGILSLLPKIKTREKKRVGRGLGSGRGAKSGRGTTRHQKARESIPLHFEGGQGRVVKKYPLLRGKGRNKSVQAVPFILSISSLNVFKDGDVVDREALVKKGLIPHLEARYRVKILSRGQLEKKLSVKLPVSQSVKKMIEDKGGKVL
ncbi:MAG: 50S ribosomal protein L15 [bacterium]|nr:50S ribosomal protein L15 [bacterium]